jgi:hypothetical protein
MTAPNDAGNPEDQNEPLEDPSIAHIVRLQRVSGALAWVASGLGVIAAIWSLLDDGFADDSGVAWWWFLIFAAALALVGATTKRRINLIRRK